MQYLKMRSSVQTSKVQIFSIQGSALILEVIIVEPVGTEKDLPFDDSSDGMLKVSVPLKIEPHCHLM